MATNYTNTLAGLLVLNDANMSEAEASDVLNDAPVLRALYAQAASQGGTQHKFLRELTAPGVGFRNIGEGITNAAGTFEDVTVNCALMDGSCTRDLGLAMGYRKGQTAYMDKESTKSLAAAFFAVECALFRSNINKQFTGFPGNAFYDQITTDAMVYNAGGTGGRSVYIINTSEGGVSIIAGNDGVVRFSETDIQVLARDANNREYDALRRSILAWFGLQIGSKYDAVRIANIDGTTGHSLTDDVIFAALKAIPVSHRKNLICVMSRTSQEELRASRTAVNPTGAPALLPEFVAQNIPVIVTEALPEDEAAINTTTTTTTTSTQA